jgi:hypothetical protein
MSLEKLWNKNLSFYLWWPNYPPFLTFEHLRLHLDTCTLGPKSWMKIINKPFDFYYKLFILFINFRTLIWLLPTCRAGAWLRRGAGILVGWGMGLFHSGLMPVPRGGDPAQGGSRARPEEQGSRWFVDPAWTQPGAAQGVGILQGRARGSAGLRGGDLADRFFFYYIVVWRSLPWSKGLGCRFFPLPGVLPQSSVSAS